MKKLTGIVCLLALVLALTACAGAGDWKYEELPGDYAVWRINRREIPLVRVDADGLTAEPVVEGYVYAVAWDENTIYVQQRAEKDKGDMAYYMVALDSGTVSGPYTETQPARNRVWTRPISAGRSRRTGTRSMTGKRRGNFRFRGVEVRVKRRSAGHTTVI